MPTMANHHRLDLFSESWKILRNRIGVETKKRAFSRFCETRKGSKAPGQLESRPV
jgi:hypothetical protein